MLMFESFALRNVWMSPMMCSFNIKTANVVFSRSLDYNFSFVHCAEIQIISSIPEYHSFFQIKALDYK